MPIPLTKSGKPDKRYKPKNNTHLNTPNNINNISKLSQYDKRAIELLKQDPNLTNHQIGKQLQEQGLSNNERTIYSRLKHSECLSLEINKVRTYNHEFLSREIVPLALKTHKAVLKDKSIEAKDKKDWVAMAEKAEFRIDTPYSSPRTINIITQQNIGLMLKEDTKPKVIEGEVIDNKE